jgi:hypothetical protein
MRRLRHVRTDRQLREAVAKGSDVPGRTDGPDGGRRAVIRFCGA